MRLISSSSFIMTSPRIPMRRACLLFSPRPAALPADRPARVVLAGAPALAVARQLTHSRPPGSCGLDLILTWPILSLGKARPEIGDDLVVGLLHGHLGSLLLSLPLWDQR